MVKYLHYIIVVFTPLLSGWSELRPSPPALHDLSFLSRNSEVAMKASFQDPEILPEDPMVLITAENDSIKMYLIAGVAGLVLFVMGYMFNRRKSKAVADREALRKAGAAFPEALSDDSIFNEDDNSGTTVFSPTVFSTQSSPAILVAECDEDMRMFITNALRLNYRVIAVADGLKAYQKAVAIVPDLIIVDTELTGMDGMTLCHSLKSTEATSHVPVLMLTRRSEMQSNADEVHLHADDFLLKPFDARALLINVKELIGLKKRLQVAFREELATGESNTFDLYPNDLAFMHKLNGVIEKNYADHRFGVDNLSDQINLTRLQLYRKMKALINKSPGDYLRQYRIDKAKQLLSHDNYPINEVAYQTGFSSITNFSKVFRAHTGLSPVDFCSQSASGTLTENQ